MVSEILAAVVGGFAGWVAVQAVSHFVVRSRLIAYLIIQVNTHLQATHSNKDWLQKLCGDTSVPGKTARVAPRYSADRAEDLHACRELILRYLRRSEIERVTRFLSHLWEVEYLTEGACEAFGAYAKQPSPMSADDCRYLCGKTERVASIVSKWPHSIERLRDLPADYAGVRGPEAVSVPPKPSPR